MGLVIDKIIGALMHKHKSDDVTNSSVVTGTTVTDALNNLLIGQQIPDVWKTDIATIRLIDYANCQNGDDVGNYTTGYIYQFDSTSAAVDDGSLVLKPHDAGASNGRWLKQVIMVDTNIAQTLYNKTFGTSNIFIDNLSSGLMKLTLGIPSIATAGTDYIVGGQGSSGQSAYFTGTGTLAGATGILMHATQMSLGGIPIANIPANVFLVVGDTGNSSPRGLMSWQSSTDAYGGRFHLRKSRGTFVAPTTVVTADTLGRIVASGYTGVTGLYYETASIDFIATGTVADGAVGVAQRLASDIVFNTSTNVAPSVLTERMRITNTGNIAIANSIGSYNLSFGGTTAKTIGVENSLTDVAGAALTLGSGSTVAGTSVNNVNGGDLVLQSGAGTGTGTNNIIFNTYQVGTTGKVLQNTLTQRCIIDNLPGFNIGSRYPMQSTTNNAYLNINQSALSGAANYPAINMTFANSGYTSIQWRSAYSGAGYTTAQLKGGFDTNWAGNYFKMGLGNSDGTVFTDFFLFSYAGLSIGTIGSAASTFPNGLSGIIMGGTTARTVGVEANIATAAGQNLTIYAGNNTAGGTADLKGGDLIFTAGLNKGTGGATPSNIIFNYAPVALTGTTVPTAVEGMRLTYKGDVNISLGAMFYFAVSPTADTVNDARLNNIAGTLTIQKCTVANATKGGGTWA